MRSGSGEPLLSHSYVELVWWILCLEIIPWKFLLETVLWSPQPAAWSPRLGLFYPPAEDRSRAVSPISQSGSSRKYWRNSKLVSICIFRFVFHLYCLTDPLQFFWSGLISRRGWLVIILIGKPPEQSRDLVMVQVRQIDLVSVADLAQSVEHGQERRGLTGDWGARSGQGRWVVCCYSGDWRVFTLLSDAT